MRKIYFFILFLALSDGIYAQQVFSHEIQMAGFRLLDGEKDHFLQAGYFYNFNHRSAVGARVAYHAEQKSDFYKSQIRYLELSHRWRFKKTDSRFAWTLATGPWLQLFTSQNSGILSQRNRSGTIGLANTAGVHYDITPHFSVGISGLGLLEVIAWEPSKDPAFYPLMTPGLGIQMAYAW
jgi:hypothetical protein